jgi:hypothetical protein
MSTGHNWNVEERPRDTRVRGSHRAMKWCAQQGVQWTGGYAPRFLAFFAALSFFRFNGESHPAHQQVTQTVGRLLV